MVRSVLEMIVLSYLLGMHIYGFDLLIRHLM